MNSNTYLNINKRVIKNKKLGIASSDTGNPFKSNYTYEKKTTNNPSQYVLEYLYENHRHSSSKLIFFAFTEIPSVNIEP